MVRIHNMRNGLPPGGLFRCDRESPLGNPVRMREKTDEERNRACDAYKVRFNLWMRNPQSEPSLYLNQIVEAARAGDVYLGCWCYPLRCHCETIKTEIDKRLSTSSEKPTSKL